MLVGRVMVVACCIAAGWGRVHDSVSFVIHCHSLLPHPFLFLSFLSSCSTSSVSFFRFSGRQTRDDILLNKNSIIFLDPNIWNISELLKKKSVTSALCPMT